MEVLPIKASRRAILDHFALLIGFTKLSNSAEGWQDTLFNVDLENWKNKIITLIEAVLVV